MRIRIFFYNLLSRFWVVPGLIITGLFLVLLATLRIPNFQADGFFLSLLLRGYSPDGARLILSSMATALMTVIGVLFSLTVLVLQQVSTQYSPRIVESFIRSRLSQVTLGLFVGSFVYCLILLRQIPSTAGPAESHLPQVAISVSILLSLGCILLLMYYISHIAHAIQSTNIIASLRKDTVENFRAFHKYICDRAQASASPTSLENKHQVRAPGPGYMRDFDPDRLADILKGNPARIEMLRLPGDYLEEGEEFAVVRSTLPLAEKATNLPHCFSFGDSRTQTQDIRLGIRQLADIALRALSPGINDPTTATEAIHALGSVLTVHAKAKSMPELVPIGEDSQLLIPSVPFADVLWLAFSQIVNAAREHLFVLEAVKAILSRLEPSLEEERKIALRAFRKRVEDFAEASAQESDSFFREPPEKFFPALRAGNL